MHTTLTPSRERWLLITLAGIQFTHIVDFMIMMPLGPQLTALFAISDAQFGLLVSAYTLAAGVAGLLAASFVDRFERKRLLLWLYFFFGLTTLACALAPSYALLMLARIAAGVGARAKSAGVTSLTFLSVVCAESTTATRRVKASACARGTGGSG